MSTGLFQHKGVGQGRAFQKHRAKDRGGKETLDAFADLLAEGVSTGHAAMRLGKSPDYGRVLFAKLRKGLGWQAV